VDVTLYRAIRVQLRLSVEVMTKTLLMSFPRRKFVKLSELVGKRSRGKQRKRTQKKSSKDPALTAFIVDKRPSLLDNPNVSITSKTETQCPLPVPPVIGLSAHGNLQHLT